MYIENENSNNLYLQQLPNCRKFLKYSYIFKVYNEYEIRRASGTWGMKYKCLYLCAF